MTKEEKAIREFCGQNADWWPSTTQVQEMLALARPEQGPVSLMIYRGELCYKSQEDDQSFGMWCPVTKDLPFPEGTKLYTTPPQPKEPKQEPVAWEQFYPDIGKPQLEQLPQLSQEVVLQYPKEAVDWQKQQKEYAQQLKVEGPCHVVCQCDKCKAQEQDNAYIYASNLAKIIWQKHYMKESPKFALLDTTEGVLTQIDNMTCGLVREKPAQPEQEPVAWMSEHRLDELSKGFPVMKTLTRQRVFEDDVALYTTPPHRPWVGLTDEEIAEVAERMEASDPTDSFWREFARAIEAFHGIKE